MQQSSASKPATEGGSGGIAVELELPELLNYLKETANFSLPALDSIVVQTEAMGDPALPSAEHSAILKWLRRCDKLWQQQYPLDQALLVELQPLTPVCAALAITDPEFQQPGAHPMHQLLDTIQDVGIGWQASLGRAGQPLQKQIGETVMILRRWLQRGDEDLAEACRKALTAMKKDNTRAERMAQRTAETELGKVRTVQARADATNMINRALDQYPAPAEVASFIKGPWYDSAQLVILKYGSDSEQWRRMSSTTETLLDSLRAVDANGESRRQHIFELIARLPRELKQWLLSLQHDGDAVGRAVAMIEEIHLKILKQEEMELGFIDFLPQEENPSTHDEPLPEEHPINQIKVGQWFAIHGKDGISRARLALKIDSLHKLLFTNHAGLKALETDYSSFAEKLQSGSAIALQQGRSFSLSMARAAYIETAEQLEALRQSTEFTMRQQAQITATPQPTAAPPSAEQGFEFDLPQEPDDEEHVNTDANTNAEALLRRQAEQQQRDEQRKQLAEQEREKWLQKEPVETLARPMPTAAAEPAEQTEAVAAVAEEFDLVFSDDTEPTEDSENTLSTSDREQIEEYLRKRQQRDTPTAATSKSPKPKAAATADQPGISPDTWLGFHDGDQPTMAKLAVHDQERGLYIFVNREGMKLRELTGEALADLMDRGLVDILEARSGRS